MNYTTEEILRLVESSRARLSNEHSRELVVANDIDLDDRSREVLKKEKSKKVKHSSRLSEELNGLASPLLAETPSKPQDAFVSMIAPATTSSREIAAITAQHSKTKMGIKVSLSIQTQTDATNGEFTSLTAELKRHNRLRELKRYSGDTAEFEEHYINTINDLKELTPEKGKSVCCGRIHERGKRAAWFADMMVVGNLNEEDHLTSIIIWYGTEEYVVEMSDELSPRQKESYHSAGIYGELKTNKVVPTLATAKRRTL